MASLQLAEKIASDEHSNRLQAAAMHTQLVEWMTREEQVATALIQQRPNLLDYVSADGVVVWWDGRASAVGRAPSEAQIADLVAWLNTNVPEGVFVTDRLVEHYPPAERYQDVASGLVALSISRSPRDYVLWFRPEIIETITWAGNPGKAVEVVDGAARLGPRKSFAGVARDGARPLAALAGAHNRSCACTADLDPGGRATASRSSCARTRGCPVSTGFPDGRARSPRQKHHHDYSIPGAILSRKCGQSRRLHANVPTAAPFDGACPKPP